LYRLTGEGSVKPVIDRVTISNGLAWSPDDRRMYFIDSASFRIDVLDYDVDTGEAVNRRPLVELPKQDGLPDGMTIDVDGCLWVALYDGSAVRRFTPDGALDREVRLPVARVTSCAFGGAGLGDLYVTSARAGLGEVELGEQPLAGGLFVVRSGTRGFPEVPFGG
jgi:sugar lactone lactonase YvrE